MSLETENDRYRSLRLIDDFFMKVFFKGNIEATQLVLRIILGRDDITVESVRVESNLDNLDGRGAVLDIHAKDNSGTEFDVEIQRSSSGALPERAGYHLSLMHTHMLPKNCGYELLNDAYVIFITESDAMGIGKPIAVFETQDVETHEKFNDKRHIIYVNGAARCSSTELGRLMEDFFCTDPEHIHYPEIRNKFKYLKETEAGRKEFMDFEEMILSEGIEKRNIEIAKNLIELGENSLESIAKVTGLDIDKVRELAGQKAV